MKLEFNVTNTKPIIAWLKRFSLINETMLLEIDVKNKKFLAKTHNETRSVVKFSSISFDDANFELKSKVDNKTSLIMVGVFSISKLMSILDQFSNSDFLFSLEYQEIIKDNEKVLAGEKIIIKNPQLTMTVMCTSLSIFVHIPTDKFINHIATGNIISETDIDRSIIEKINSLNKLDTDKKILKFKIDDNKIYISGKTYDLEIGKTKNVENMEVPIFKEQYSMLDNENYSTSIVEEKLVFHSKDSDTCTVIAMVIEE